MFGKRLANAFKTPGVRKAFRSSFNTLRGQLDKSWRQSGIVIEFSKRMHGHVDHSAWNAKWNKRMVELGDGQMPSPSVAGDLYVKNAWNDARMATFLSTVLSNRTVRGEMAMMLDELFAVEPVVDELRNSTAAIVSDSTFQDATVKLILLLAEDPNDEDAIQSQTYRLLTTPAVVAAVNRLVRVILTDVKVEKIVLQHFDRIAADSEISKAADDFFNNW